MTPTAQTKIRRQAEKKYMINSKGFFTPYEPINVLTPIIKKNTENNRIAIFLIHIRAFM
jgi:hypothetical protein